MIYNQQIGSILILTLSMLLFLQFVAITVVNSTSVSSKVVSNFKLRKQLQRKASYQIDNILKNKQYFVNYSAYLNSDGNFEIPLNSPESAQISTKIINFKCIDKQPAGLNLNCNLNNKYWELTVRSKDATGHTKVEIVQGIKLSLLHQEQATHTLGAQKFSIQRLWWYLNQTH